LDNNQFNGTIPTQLAQLTALSYLYVAIIPSGVRVHSGSRVSSQDLAQQSTHRTDSSVEFVNYQMVNDAFTLHLFDLIYDLINSNQRTANIKWCQLPGEPSSK
jgi:hypothetical protein